MPIKNRKNYNSYMSEYMLRRYKKRRAFALKRLGRKCVQCDSTKRLQVDHINPELKSFYISKLWSVSWERFVAELDKCQLLCEKCHVKKSVEERGQKLARGTHGTLSSYRYCKCKKCRAAKAKYNKERRKIKGR